MLVEMETLKETLKKKLNAEFVDAKDTSGGCGQSYEVIIVSSLFEGKPLLQRHRMVNEAVREEIAQIHAFSQKTYTPGQWAALN